MDECIVRSYIRKMAMLEMAYTMETETDAAVVLRMIDDAPAADVAPVLRCKDCKDWGPGTGDVPICWETYEPMPPDGFCSYGERKPSADG